MNPELCRRARSVAQHDGQATQEGANGETAIDVLIPTCDPPQRWP